MALGWLWYGFARAGLEGLSPPRAFGDSVFCHLPSAFLCQGALSKTRAFLARFLVCTAKPSGRLTRRRVASARRGRESSRRLARWACPRRRCLSGGSPVQPRRVSHVGQVTHCGLGTYWQILVLLA